MPPAPPEPRRARRAGRDLAASFVVTLGLSACGGGSSAGGGAAPEEGAPAPVQVVAVARDRWAEALEVTGALAAYERATVAAEVPGRVVAAQVDVGSVVTEGQTLVQVDATDLRLEVDRAAAALAEARARLGLPPGDSLEGEDDAVPTDRVPSVTLAQALLDEALAGHARVVALRERGIVSPSDLDAAEAALRAARSRLQDARDDVEARRSVLAQRRVALRTARERLRRADVRAPFPGAVLSRLVAPGDYVQAGTPVCTVVRVDPLRLRADVPERLAHRVKPGLLVRAAVEGAAPREARLSRVSPALAETGRVLVVETDLPNEDGALRAGGFARVSIVVDPEATTLVVPPSAIRSFAGLDKVLVVAEGKTTERRVTLGRREAGRVEVVEGLEEGEQVVLEPGGLRTGQRVTVAGK